MNILFCLVAGVCMKCSDCDGAHRYLIEGLKMIDSKFYLYAPNGTTLTSHFIETDMATMLGNQLLPEL